ncbi:MAG: hypothetical protein KAV87_06940 [Desulfobacteraceae bacterium]|nr:hypothetical protein [Desulfobacteraceae bacterium]
MTDVNEQVFGTEDPTGTPTEPTPLEVVAQPPDDAKTDPVVDLIASSDDPPVAPAALVDPTVDPLRDKETGEFWQTRYQKLMATLDKDVPAPILGQPAIPATPAPVAPIQQPAQEEDEYKVFIQDQIQAGFDQINQNQQAQQTANAEAQFLREEKQAGAELSKFASDTGVTQEQLNEAYNMAQDMGIPYRRIGGPTAYVRYIAQHLDHQRLRGGPTPHEVTTLAAAEQKVLADKMVVQPSLATPGAPVAQSREEKILGIMQGVGTNPDVNKAVFE